MNVTGVPLQTEVPGLALMLTEGVTVEVTVMVMLLLVALAIEVQEALLVMMQLITSLLFRVAGV